MSLPLRVAVVASAVTLPPGWEALETPVVHLLDVAFFEWLVRHPALSVVDPEDRELVGRDGRVLTRNHPHAAEIRREEFAAGRRVEVLAALQARFTEMLMGR